MVSLRRSTRIAQKITVEKAQKENKTGGRKEKKKDTDQILLRLPEEENTKKVVETIVKNEEKEDECPICMEALSRKRVLTGSPCEHVIHRTCGIKWIETRKSKAEQSCPMCRSAWRVFIDKTRPTDWKYLFLDDLLQGNITALGSSGQPTKYSILNHRDVVGSTHSNRIGMLLSFLSNATTMAIPEVKEALAEAKEARRDKEFIADISEELAKLRKRARILADMTRIHKRGGMRFEEATEKEEEWNYQRELAALKAS